MDGEEIVLTWSPGNWATVVLMVALGFAALALAAQAVHHFRKKKSGG